MQTISVTSPLTIRRATFRNRIIMPSMVTNFAGRNGEVSENSSAIMKRAPSAAWG